MPNSKHPKNQPLPSKIRLVAVAAIAIAAVLLFTLYLQRGQTAPPSGTTLLYVQTAHSGTLSAEQDGRRILTLNDVSPNTVYFSDRPDRITGHESTEAFIAQWNKSLDSFASNPPNAALDVIGEHSQSLAIVELMNAQYDAQSNTLEYEVILLDDESEGPFPDVFDEAALFIDSTHVDYKCDCELSAGEDICKCRYTYTLGASKTKEFRGYCSNGLIPDGVHVGGKSKSTSCTNNFPWFDYYSRSCTNWDPISSDKLNITVRCAQ